MDLFLIAYEIFPQISLTKSCMATKIAVRHKDSGAAFIAGTEYANSSFLHIIAFIFAHFKWEKLCT